MDMATNKHSSSADLFLNQGALDPKALAKRMLSDALAPVASKLAELDAKLIGFIPAESSTSRQVLQHVFSSGGKRIRPALYFFCCDLLKYDGEHLHPIAAVCEFVHTASLLHDDVVDSSSLRRNKPTANSIWGDQASVLVGDLIYSTASEMMAATGSLDIVKGFARAIRLMSEGELLQLEASFQANVRQEQYNRVVYCKTAELIAMACRSAAVLANAGKAAENALYDFGKNLGIAFQLIDDALDYVGNRELFGKPTLSDLKEGKVTLPVIMLFEKASEAEVATINKIVVQSLISDEDVAYVSQLVAKYETDEATIQLANSYTDIAIAGLDAFPDSEAKENLVNIAKRLVWRFT